MADDGDACVEANMKTQHKLLLLPLALVAAIICLGAASIKYDVTFDNLNVRTNATLAGTASADRMVATNGVTAGASVFDVSLTLTNSSGYYAMLKPDAANTLALRNGVNAQTFNIYNTYTDAANYERGFMRYSGNVLEIGHAKAGTGSDRTVRFYGGGIGVNGFEFYIGSAPAWRIDSSGRLISLQDNVLDIGASGANRPRDVFVARNIESAGYIKGSSYYLGGNGSLGADANGVFKLRDNAGTDFNRLQFGGTTSAYPAKGRNTTGFSSVLADDSGPSFDLQTRAILAKTTNYTAVAATATTHTDTDVSKVFTNEGASAGVTITLPTAVAGYTYTFVVQDADGLTITAAAGDTIRIAGSVTGAAGNISATTIGNVVTLCAINATEWISLSHEGTWTVSAP